MLDIYILHQVSRTNWELFASRNLLKEVKEKKICFLATSEVGEQDTIYSFPSLSHVI